MHGPMNVKKDWNLSISNWNIFQHADMYYKIK